jgi:hypothetical protein
MQRKGAAMDDMGEEEKQAPKPWVRRLFKFQE